MTHRYDPVLHDLAKHLSEEDKEIAKSDAISDRADEIYDDMIGDGFVYRGAIYNMSDIIEKICGCEKAVEMYESAIGDVVSKNDRTDLLCLVESFGKAIATELAEWEWNDNEEYWRQP